MKKNPARTAVVALAPMVILVLAGCGAHRPVIDPKTSAHPERYESDLAECQQLAQQAPGAGTGAAGGAAIGAAIGAGVAVASGHKASAGQAAGGAAVLGGAKGAGGDTATESRPIRRAKSASAMPRRFVVRWQEDAGARPAPPPTTRRSAAPAPGRDGHAHPRDAPRRRRATAAGRPRYPRQSRRPSRRA